MGVIQSDWVQFKTAISVSDAASHLPRLAGKYAFFIDDLTNLPICFRKEAQTRPCAKLLYLGKTDVSLYTRVWEEECQHRRPGTFFRSVGAMLGYKSPRGGKSYQFAQDDKSEVIAWIRQHLRVTWTDEVVDGSHRESEAELIRQFTPLLNIQGNPKKFVELSQLRASCRLGGG